MTGSTTVTNHSPNMQLNPMTDTHWLKQARFSTLATLPWNQSNGIAGQLTADAMGMGFQTEAPAKVWGPVVLKKRLAGGVFVFSGGEMLGLDAQGAIGMRLPWQKGAVLDLVEVGSKLLLLHENVEGGVELVCLTVSGNEEWSRKMSPETKHLLQVEGTIYLVQHPKNQNVSLHRIDASTGETSNVYPSDSKTSPVFAGKEGEICFLSYDPAANQRVWNRQVLGGGVVSTAIPTDLYGLFAFPASSDAQSNAYGIFGMEAGKFAIDGSESWRMKLEALVPSEDGSFWISESKGAQVRLMRAQGDKVEHSSVTIPAEFTEAGKPVQWRLVRVESEFFYLSGLNPSNYKRVVLACNRETGAVATTNPGKGPGEFGSVLQGGRNWSFAAEGNLILPVATPEALVLVRVAM